jgi:hypothetical protein
MNDEDKKQNTLNRIRGKSLINLKNKIECNGLNLNRLQEYLWSEEFYSVKFSEACETINKMKLTYADLRFTSENLLIRKLGLKVLDVFHFGFQMLLMTDRTDFFTDTIFHISQIKNDKVSDFGFFIGREDDERLEKSIQEPVAEIENCDFSVPISPQNFHIDSDYHKSSGFGWFEEYCHENKRMNRTRLGWSIYKSR